MKCPWRKLLKTIYGNRNRQIQGVHKVMNDLPDPAIFKEMGAGSIDAIALFDQLGKNFDLKAFNP